MMPAATAGQEWPQFRGPSGDGVAATADPPVRWSESQNIKWKASVPGRGRSSPVVSGNRIWLTTALERGVKRTRIASDDMQVADYVALEAICLDRADGKRLWRTRLFEVDKPAPVHWLNSWATPTPVVEPGRLYCDFGTFGTACLDSESGRVLWKRQLPLDHQVGPGSSPVLYQNLLVLVRDGRNAQYVAALDKNTGQTLWKTDRPPLAASNGYNKKSFSTPLVIVSNGRTQMVVPGAWWVVSYDPISGKEIWRIRHGDGFSLAPRPVFGHGMVYVCTGALAPQLWAIRPEGQGTLADSQVGWKAASQIPVMSSPILVGDEIYCVSDSGIASCFDALTGKLHWRERLGGTYLASPVCAGGRLYLFDRDGKTTVLRAAKQFARLAENRLEGPVVATPAVVDRSILLRTDSQVYWIEGP